MASIPNEFTSDHPLAKACKGQLFIEKGKIKDSDKSPEVAVYARQYSEHVVKQMTAQLFECDWAHLRVERDKTIVEIYWQFKETAGDPMNYNVLGVSAIVDFEPDPTNVYFHQVAFDHGNDGIRMRCREGMTFFFEFMFIRKDFTGSANAEESSQSIRFVVGIPLSDESKAILNDKLPPERKAAQKMRDELDHFLEKQDAVDDMIERATRHIKAKGLSPAEEEEKIAEFRDYVAAMKDKFGV